MSGKVLVISVHGKRPSSLIEYVGRSTGGWKGSVLGNPFVIGRDGNRQQCVQKYHRWLCKHVQDSQSPVRKEVIRLAQRVDQGEDVVLGCWCVPNLCHASVIRKAILYVLAHPES